MSCDWLAWLKFWVEDRQVWGWFQLQWFKEENEQL